MIEKEFEAVSSLVDGEQPNNELLDQIGHDEQLSDTWEQYHLIGDIMRDEVSDNISLELSDNIAAAIEQEPTVLAPRASKSFTSKVKGKVVQFARPFGQMAIAASAAGLMILGVQTNVAENETVAPSQVVQTIPLGGIADPVSFNYTTNDRASQKQAYIEQQRRFQALLADHQQQIKLSSVTKVQETEANEKVEELPK
ncbi:sigma-E factor negative regulatory protein [Thalassotalea atypica]|uniref:sigma-E factor negative regulatory protein n=1 Tax=Thalassotalea atypica TaxID=2054316 RepID=UPI0025738E47|nr:RseA family anti-sigma factor [Thalassotalea atypica]